MRINSVPGVKCFCNNKMCYVHNQWYDISCATPYMFMWSACKVPDTLVTFQGHLHFLDRFLKIPQISNFIKIRPVGAELLHVNTQI